MASSLRIAPLIWDQLGKIERQFRSQLSDALPAALVLVHTGPPHLLPDIVTETGPAFLSVDARTIARRFTGDRTEQIIVQAREIGDDFALFSVNLPKPGFFGKDAGLQALLRATFVANYVEAVAVSPSGLALAAELPIRILTPPIAEGLIRGLVHLGDLTKGDLTDWASWTKRLQRCAQSQAVHISVTADEAEQAMREEASQAGLTMSRNQGTWLLELRIGGQALRDPAGLDRLQDRGNALALRFDWRIQPEMTGRDLVQGRRSAPRILPGRVYCARDLFNPRFVSQ